MSVLKSRWAAGGVVLFAAWFAQADEPSQVQAASLEVKARIKSMEQVNVTAEKSIDESLPAASAEVTNLLQALEDIDTLEIDALENDSANSQKRDALLTSERLGSAAGSVLNK